MQPDELRRKTDPGDVFTREDYNALVDFVTQAAYNQAGYAEPGLAGVYPEDDKDPPFWKLFTAIDIPPYSVFVQAKLDTFDGDLQPTSPIYAIAHTLADVNDILYLTNGQNTMQAASGGNAWCRAIGAYIPTRLAIDSSGSAVMPIPGQWCGPIPGSLSVSGKGHGLICIAVESESEFCWCIQPGKTPTWLVKTSGVLAPNVPTPLLVWAGPPGSESATSISITCVYKGTTPITGAVFCIAIGMQGAKYLIPLTTAPEELVLVKVISGPQDPDTCTFPGVVCDPDFTLTSWCGDPFPEVDLCEIRILNSAPGDVSTPGTYYLAKQIGDTTGDGLGLPVYAVQSGTGTAIVRFELTADLQIDTDSGGINAVILDWNETTGLYTASTKAIVVVDITTQRSRGNWEGYKIQGTVPAGYRGWAVKKDRKTEESEPQPVYEIIWMEHTARALAFQTVTNVNTAQTLQLYDGRDPEDKAGAFPVNDTMSLFRWRTLGGVGIVMRNDQATPPNYEMVCAETWSGFASGLLSTDLTDSMQPVTVMGYWGTQQDVQQPQSPAGFQRITNTFPYAKSGGVVIGALDAILGFYHPLVADQVSPFQVAQLSAPLNAADTIASVAGGSQYSPGFFPFSQEAPPFTSAINPYHCSGDTGNFMLFMWDEVQAQWEVVCGNIPSERLYTGSTTGALTGGAADVAGLVPLTTGIQAPTSTVSADNPMGYRSDTVVGVIVAESGTSPYTYTIISCAPQMFMPVVNMQLSGMTFQMKQRAVWAYLGPDDGAWEDIWVGANCPPPAIAANYEPSEVELEKMQAEQKRIMLEKGQEKV